MYNGVTEIGQYAFSDCTSLTNITIPDSVVRISDRAFVYSGLVWITIGKNVVSFGAAVFSRCDDLVGVYFRGDAPYYIDRTFLYGLPATVYRLAEASGWESTSYNRPIIIYGPPAIVNAGTYDGQFGFTVSGVESSTVTVEAALLPTGPWAALMTKVIRNGSFLFSDPDWKSYPARFYRLRSPEGD